MATTNVRPTEGIMEHRTFTVTAATSFDGTPYEVAARSVAQSSALLALLSETVEEAILMARNAELSRNLYADDTDAKAETWDDTPQARQFLAVQVSLTTAAKRLRALELAAGFDPRAR